MTSFEPGEDWFWNYRIAKAFYGPKLAPPRSRHQSSLHPGQKAASPQIGKIILIENE
jgi:hypothetical protein